MRRFYVEEDDNGKEIRLVPLFEMRLIEINTHGDYKVIKSFKNMKANNKDIAMAKAYYNSRTHKGE